MRPAAIVNFERLFLGSLVVGLAGLFLFPAPDDELPLLEIGTLLVSLVLVLLVSRRRSNVVRWILSLLTVLGLPLLVRPLLNGESIDAGFLLSVLSSALQLGAVAMLWTSAASSWFAQESSAPAD